MPNRGLSQRGFTLIELLVVMLIVGLGYSLVRFNTGANNPHQLRSEARQFANTAALVAEEAVLSHQQWGVDIFRLPAADFGEQDDRFGYRWLVRSEDDYWQLATGPRYGSETLFSRGMQLRLQLEESDEEVEIGYQRDIREQDALIEERKTLAEQLGEEPPPDADEKLIQPAIWLLSSGEISAFELTLFSVDNPDALIVVEGDALGRVALKKPDEDDDE